MDFDDVFSLLPPLRADIDRVIAVVRRSLSGEDGLMAEAVTLKFIPTPLTKEQVKPALGVPALLAITATGRVLREMLE